ncbi:GNAT family N-acetyltransferase [Shewanella sp.]|nr:GNAT family N-acetyltransferase [Shewanella sp.]
MLTIIPYHRMYAAQVSQLCHVAINAIDDSQYSEADRRAWSFAPRSDYHWHKRLTRTQTWLMVDEQPDAPTQCCAVINLETHFHRRGYIDSLYVAPQYQHQGVAKALLTVLENWALQAGIDCLSVDASKLSKPLFLAHGFKQRRRSYQEKNGQVIMGFLMYKSLNA